MSATGHDADAAPPRGIRTVAVEAATSLLLASLAVAAMWDSRRLGAGWGAEGPQSGYFPFWIGAVLLLASLCNLVQAFRARGGGGGSGRHAQGARPLAP